MSIKKTLYEKDLYSDEEHFQQDCAAIAKERLLRGEIDRRTFVKALAFLGAVPAFTSLGGGSADAAEELVVVNWGGPAVDAYYQAFGVPFEKATGVKVVIDGTGPLGSKIRAMVESKNVTWDVVDTGAGTTLVLGAAGVIEDIDYSIVDKSKVLPEFAFEKGIANYMFSFVLAYNQKRLEKVPQSWADFWNLADFPGPRTLRKQPNGMMEACMQAAGRSMSRSLSHRYRPGRGQVQGDRRRGDHLGLGLAEPAAVPRGRGRHGQHLAYPRQSAAPRHEGRCDLDLEPGLRGAGHVERPRSATRPARTRR